MRWDNAPADRDEPREDTRAAGRAQRPSREERVGARRGSGRDTRHRTSRRGDTRGGGGKAGRGDTFNELMWLAIGLAVLAALAAKLPDLIDAAYGLLPASVRGAVQ